MTFEEQKQLAIDKYTDLLRIKSVQKEINEELEKQLVLAKVKLQTFAIDVSELEKIFLKSSN